MNRRFLAAGFCGATVLAACSTPTPERPAASPQAAPSPPPAAAPLIPPLTLDGYKKEFARRVASASSEVFADPLPEMFKSIVVLDVNIDRDGNLARVSVRRSNGYKALEIRAVESVRRAAPFAAPAFTVRGRDGSVNFLETFLFRDDGRFQIRSLVE
ncbi:MAG TPA: TonB family protein [Burkholderiales bacterium]